MKPFNVPMVAGLIAILFAPLRPFAAETNGLAAALQKGLFEEEANRNPAEAIKAYEAAIARFDEDRKLAATAVFRLAECYRKQGRTNDALAQYQRVARDFSDEANLAELSRQSVATLGSSASESGSPLPPPLQGRPATGERDEIARIRVMIRDSPDLLNAPDPQTGQVPLQKAASQGQVSVARYLLDSGADVNAKTRGSSYTPLHIAAANGHKAMVDLLLSRKADVNAADNAGATPLHHAAMQGFKTVAEVLAAHAADIDARDNSGDTPLHYAARAGSKAMVEWLLDKKANINARNELNATPLLVAAAEKQGDVARLLVERKADPSLAGGVSVEGTSRFGVFPVHVAVLTRNDELLGLLLQHGADPNVEAAPRDQQTPLEMAVHSGRKSSVELLLKAGADPNRPDRQGAPPLIVAIDRGARESLEIVGMLLNSKADPNAKLRDGTPAIFIAIRRGYKLAVEALLDHKADIEIRNSDRRTPLVEASAFGQKEIVALLLSRGANPNAADSGYTPLAVVAMRLGPSGAPTLLGPSGAPTLPNSPERSAYEAIATLLKQNGALQDVPRLDGIELRRPSIGFSQVTLWRGTGDWNRFTLLELLAIHCGFVSAAPQVITTPGSFDGTSHTVGALPFPDLAHIMILRATPDGRGRSNMVVNLEANLAKQGCEAVPLQWGDAVEIPELDHPISARWTGFSTEQQSKFIECLKRTVSIHVKGITTNMLLAPEIPSPEGWFVGSPPFVQASFQHVIPQFTLLPVLVRSQLLRASSDLSRVKVRRAQPAGQARDSAPKEWVFDCSRTAPPPDFWVEDGDEIVVPERY